MNIIKTYKIFKNPHLNINLNLLITSLKDKFRIIMHFKYNKDREETLIACLIKKPKLKKELILIF